MDYREAIPLVRYVVDNAGNGRPLGADRHAFVRLADPNHPDGRQRHWKYRSVLVGWDKRPAWRWPLFIAVHSYLDVPLCAEEAIEETSEYMMELGLFWPALTPHPDHVLL